MPKFQKEEPVKLAEYADFKYNRRAGAIGNVYDTFYSDEYDAYVYEIDFDVGFDLVHEEDLVAVKDNEL